MTEQNKLRKFKLINCKGFKDEIVAYCGINYLNANYKSLSQGMVIEGLISNNGSLISEQFKITKIELERYFEEVLEEEEDTSVKSFTFDGYICKVAGLHPTKGSKTIYVRVHDNKIGEIETKLLTELMKPKSWQEELCEEYENSSMFKYFEYEKVPDLIKLEGYLESDELINFAKRILELSGEK